MIRCSRRSLLLTGALVAAGLIAAASASASFPGEKGPLVVSLTDECDQRFLATLAWRGGSEPVPITPPCEGHDMFSPDPAPDGRSVLAMEGPEHPETHAEVTRVAIDGTGSTSITLPPEYEGGGSPSFAPDGQRFAFVADGVLWESRLDGTDVRRISRNPRCSEGNCVSFGQPRWSPDGKLIAVEVHHLGKVPRRPEPPRPGEWLIRSSDGKPVRRIAGTRATRADWSPKGRALVYATAYNLRDGGGANGGNLYVVSRNGERRRTLVHREKVAETSPAWSPDGRWVAWVSIRPTGDGSSVRVNPAARRIRSRGGRIIRIGRLPEPYVDPELGFFDYPPELTWAPKP